MRELTRLPIRKQLALTLLLTVILEFGCGGSSLLKSFRIALASSGPLIQSLVASGVLPQTRATAIITDFNDGAACGLALQEAFAAIPKELPETEKKARKYQASLTAAQCFRVIVNRQNFAAHPRVKQIADIAEGVLQSLVLFYGPPTGAAAVATDEKDLEKKLKAKVDEMERLLKP